ncbi:WD40 repeat-like protein [Fomitiporia mediterranea MF3/22]|uniref:WD40 repeat-like protein n=1 Tax=Fomitiporia mediterranea (strain MF3/22) TaxID=694068 RepID=UPI0004409308|nr:WD40 repeat-like protein [Fomitiporia mediterranea MF3/22]EJD02328.1 WD40 repeat-like protein [Fomitiporia mediterranea MF3/22]
MPKLTEYELERQANIARNQALLESLNLKEAAANLVSRKRELEKQPKAKPIQPAKRVKREVSSVPEPRRQSLRLRKEVIDPNLTPEERRKREAEAEKRRKQEEEERLAAEERAREAKRPRHHDLDLSTLMEPEGATEGEKSDLKSTLQSIVQTPQPRRIAARDAFVYDDDASEKVEIERLRESLQKMKIVSRAKVTQDRIYSAAFHPEKSKDLIFFGDKHGQLGIWDARAPPDEVKVEDGDVPVVDDREGGKYWRLQPHWPATAKSSLSCIKFDPVDSHSVFTSAYDCTIRSTAFNTGISREVFSVEGTLICSFDLPPKGQEMWVSDAEGGLSHVDLREDKSKARRWYLSDQKIGCISVNPTDPEKLVVASNSRKLTIWDARKLGDMPLNLLSKADYPPAYEPEQLEKYKQSKGKDMLLGEWRHNKSVSAAYWDPRGRSIVSTCYDDNLRIWDVGDELNRGGAFRSFKPFCNIKHDCQTGRWVTIFKAQWSPNPDAYPHFTIGNMKHSLDIFSGKGDLLVRLYDSQKISATQAVTCSHPSIVERAASGNASGRCVLWGPADLSE